MTAPFALISGLGFSVSAGAIPFFLPDIVGFAVASLFLLLAFMLLISRDYQIESELAAHALAILLNEDAL